MIKKFTLLFMISMFAFSCDKQLQYADAIIEKSIEVSGGTLLKNSIIEFDFRGRHYSANRHRDDFSLSRLIINSSDTVFDILSNNGFKRFVNKEQIHLADSMSSKYSSSINSVHYFSVLPYGLNGSAVNKVYSGKTKLKGKDYHKIKVTFNQEGGGEDFEDVFIYWVNTENYKVDYLAYSYNESDGLGLRFRETYNERYVKGIRFVDYNNYKPTNNHAELEDLDRLFISNELKLLSKIELENVVVVL